MRCACRANAALFPTGKCHRDGRISVFGPQNQAAHQANVWLPCVLARKRTGRKPPVAVI